MKKTLSNIFDEANANELEKLVSQNAASDVSADTLSSIKNKVYTKTGITKAKTKKSFAFRWQSYVAVNAAIKAGKEPSKVFSTISLISDACTSSFVTSAVTIVFSFLRTPLSDNLLITV